MPHGRWRQSALRIQAALDGTSQTATRQVADGPGPSIIDLPRLRYAPS